MALGALIGAYQEDDSGGLRALYPLAGRTLVEYQVRCAAAAGASPVVVMVERLPAALNDALERLRQEGMPVTAVSDGADAASRFEAGMPIVLIADGLAPDYAALANLAEYADPTVLLVPDDEAHRQFERVDATSRWAGLALVDAPTLGSTVAMLGDWDLQSTLLRRTVQSGARRLEAHGEAGGGLLADRPEDLAGFERHLIVATRGARPDWASRYALPVIEEFATERLMDSPVRPQALLLAAVVLTAAAAFGFSRGWLWQAYLLLLLAAPLDLVAARLAALRLRPLPSTAWARRLLWPLGGLALLMLGWRIGNHGEGWGATLAAVATLAFAQAARTEAAGAELPGRIWLFSRRNAVVGAIPFVIGGLWLALLLTLLLYASASFFIAQHLRHRLVRD